MMPGFWVISQPSLVMATNSDSLLQRSMEMEESSPKARRPTRKRRGVERAGGGGGGRVGVGSWGGRGGPVRGVEGGRRAGGAESAAWDLCCILPRVSRGGVRTGGWIPCKWLENREIEVQDFCERDFRRSCLEDSCERSGKG